SGGTGTGRSRCSAAAPAASAGTRAGIEGSTRRLSPAARRPTPTRSSAATSRWVTRRRSPRPRPEPRLAASGPWCSGRLLHRGEPIESREARMSTDTTTDSDLQAEREAIDGAVAGLTLGDILARNLERHADEPALSWKE